MPDKQEVSRLQRELESFARRRNELTAARLQSSSEVLNALFGDEALTDPVEKQALAERVVRALLDIIAGIEDSKDRRIAEAIFIAKPEFNGKNVSERQDYIEEHDQYPIKELYRTRRKRIVADVVYALEQTFSGTRTVVRDAVLSVTARRAARQLYRYAQRALVPLEAFDLCNNFAVRLQVLFTVVRLAKDDPADPPRGWPKIYGNGVKPVLLVPASRTDESDQGLWALAYVHRYLRTMLRDRTGRDYLREIILPPDSWESMQQRPTFSSSEIERMASELDEGQLDTPKAFVDGLCDDSPGQALHEYWLKLLTAQSVESGDIVSAQTRREAVRYLLMLSCALQDVFPEETLDGPGEEFEATVASIVQQGAEELGADLYEKGDDIALVAKLRDAVLDYSPPRYVVAEGEENREYVWSDEPCHPDVWDDLYVSRAWVMLPESADPDGPPGETHVVVLPGSPGMFGADYGHLDGRGRLER